MIRIKEWLHSYGLHPYLLITILFVAPLPFFGTLAFLLQKQETLNDLALQVERLHQKSARFQELQKKESRFLKAIKHSDPSYFDKYLSSLGFLEPEVKKLEALSLHWQQDQQVQKRLIFLQEGSNRLSFAQESILYADGWQEVEEKQQNPIECNEEDLKRILSLIEGVTIWPYGPKEGRPQLIIKDFDLVKKPLSSQESVFCLNMHLLKREGLEKED
jgi:hypothetical protein